jgi:SPP1 family predicted phage head-tail adaptor
MRNYKPSAPFTVRFELLKPTTVTKKGVKTKTFEKVLDFNASFRTFGGTESDINGVYTVKETATVDTWYNPEFKAGCQIKNSATGDVYDIVGAPDNINMRNQYIQFKVVKAGGQA